MIPINSALKLYLHSTCDKHTNYWLSLKCKAIQLKQDSLLIDEDEPENIKHCPKCSIKFGDHGDLIQHMSNEHNEIYLTP